MNSKAKILLIYTGGTIGMRKDFDTTLKAFNFSKLLQRIPELKQLDCEIETISFEEPIDSSNMNPRMGENSKHSRVQLFGFLMGLLLHGSDTMSYSASALSFMLVENQNPLFYWFTITDRFAYRCQRKFNYRYSNCFFARKWLPLLLRCAFILNISCIEETERPRSMRNILRHSRHPIILLW
jgi:hypothetical protein